ncbi:hypothetical protein HR060_16930 [Catenovulum sp. SM1970]|uniref:ethylbenzene dehydrogenase-related protein n=1 Tax=Marinifaba aquimaris TaxID=2741323 RepID=UPI001573A963|nr:ethylbenzene dehydrogenase-related protein [Marinifaba aquimaris]NTS78529.1 hypothetical protein [Marinifaba aquimaris]
MKFARCCFVAIHLVATAALLISLFTGLRIRAVLDDFWRNYSYLLPQGEVISIHLLSGMLLSLAAFCYLIYTRLKQQDKKRTTTRLKHKYHHLVIRLGHWVLITAIISGWLIWLQAPVINKLASILHYLMALAVIAYLFSHSYFHFIDSGVGGLKRVFVPGKGLKPLFFIIVFSLPALAWLSHAFIAQNQYQTLLVDDLNPDTHIDIDGIANEGIWQQAHQISVLTHGGANFDNGQTRIWAQAVQNEQEIYFALRWQDANESLSHLPLKKTEQGWKVKQQGFHHFDETEHYEDKFAVMLSNSCDYGADGTAHLGHQPLKDKPVNWHQKGYHASLDNQVRDLWHWKAVRTNGMLLADDNFIGKPISHKPGVRRYTAGYQADGKESGAYVMNWLWYKPDIIVPKRLPQDNNKLALFNQNALLPWFESTPYHKTTDRYPVGTELPSVLYRSNRFEGDRANVRAKGIWKDGYWHLELARKLDTGSQKDVVIDSGVCIWFSAFDRSQVAHTRHVRAIQLVFAS